ncbi:MAG: hypothetical protein LBF25_02925 [Puniceicoccales bacterium]|jgi:predicted lipid-binding transport protein (Tim44 family)|nr:hypothetical protein [Puniceicoccales bacterium]
MNISAICCFGSLISIAGALVGAVGCFSKAKEANRTLKCAETARKINAKNRFNRFVAKRVELAARKVQKIPLEHATSGAIIGYFGGALGSYAGGLLTGTIPGMILGGAIGSAISFWRWIVFLNKSTMENVKTVNPKFFAQDLRCFRPRINSAIHLR